EIGWFDANQDVTQGPSGIGPNLQDGTAFRRARIRFDGTMYEDVDFMAEYDFANSIDSSDGTNIGVINTPALAELWVNVKSDAPAGEARVGLMKEPIGFEKLVSSRYLTLIEMSPLFDAFTDRFTGGFTPGLLFHDAVFNERATWWFGVYRDAQQPFGFSVGDGEYAYTGRLTALPIYRDDGRDFVHLGAAASHRSLDGDRIRFRARPSLRGQPGSRVPALANTGVILSERQDLVAAELAAVAGPWSLQAEYIGSWVDDATFPQTTPAPIGTRFFQGTYIEGAVFLTGEHRAYSKRAAVFDRVTPRRDYLFVRRSKETAGGPGALQAAARFSYLDLDSGAVAGNRLYDLTLGLNWFLNPNAKFQFNYFTTDRMVRSGDADGMIQGIGSMLAFDF
ncbi:MAG: OprO/OprP family phosphate-selective porin, partial [Planctomycetia bacterium]